MTIESDNNLHSQRIVDGINQRFSGAFGWPDGFVRAWVNEDGTWSLAIGWSDVQFYADGREVGGGTDLTKLGMREPLRQIVEDFGNVFTPLRSHRNE